MGTWVNEDDRWVCSDGRFHMKTWQFGSIHQAVVDIDYDGSMSGKPISRDFSIHLSGGSTKKKAMEMCEKWVDSFKKSGPTKPQEAIALLHKYWPTLYPSYTDIPVIEQLFFIIGSGHSWLDGAIMQSSPDSWEQAARIRKNAEQSEKKHKKLMKMITSTYSEFGLDITAPSKESREDFLKQYYGGDVFRFYPVSEGFSNICTVPDDVTPEWLELSYKAALLLRDQSGVPDFESVHYFPTERDEKQQEENRILGAKVVAGLEKRFPHVKEIQQVSTQKA